MSDRHRLGPWDRGILRPEFSDIKESAVFNATLVSYTEYTNFLSLYDLLRSVTLYSTRIPLFSFQLIYQSCQCVRNDRRRVCTTAAWQLKNSDVERKMEALTVSVKRQKKAMWVTFSTYLLLFQRPRSNIPLEIFYQYLFANRWALLCRLRTRELLWHLLS